MGTASGHGQVRDSVEILPMPPPKVAANLAGGPTAPPPQAVAILAGGPTAQRRKRALSGRKLDSVHPETSDGKQAVSDLERRHFSSCQGNRGVARRRTYVRRTRNPKD